jgi:prepilin peptidase CpaA
MQHPTAMFGIHIAAVLAFAALLLWAASEDLRRLEIPNWVSLSIVGLYPIHVLTSPVSVNWPIAAAIAAVTLAVGFALFAWRMVGGGDVKLLSATALWVDPILFPSFILFTTLVGGIMAAVLIIRRWRMMPASDGIVRQASATVLPYGVAIAAGGMVVAVSLLSGVRP